MLNSTNISESLASSETWYDSSQKAGAPVLLELLALADLEAPGGTEPLRWSDIEFRWSFLDRDETGGAGAALQTFRTPETLRKKRQAFGLVILEPEAVTHGRERRNDACVVVLCVYGSKVFGRPRPLNEFCPWCTARKHAETMPERLAEAVEWVNCFMLDWRHKLQQAAVLRSVNLTVNPHPIHQTELIQHDCWRMRHVHTMNS